MKVINDLDKSHVSGMMVVKAELEEVEKRMVEINSVLNNSLKSVKETEMGQQLERDVELY